MTFAVALLTGAGVLLLASPFLWPRGSRGPVRDDGCFSARDSGFRWAREQLAAAGLARVSLVAMAAASILMSLTVAALTFALLPVLALAAVVAVVSLVIPALIVVRRASSIRRGNRVLWPDVVDHLVSAVRSGLALPDSLAVLAHTGPLAMREAFASFDVRYRATGDFGFCLDELKEVLADPVADRILETVRMSREVGGSELTTVLRSLAAYVRQDAAIRSEVEARQSWVMNSARLGVTAPWVVLALLSTRPEAVAVYNTPAGAALVIGGLGLSVVAYQVMVGLGRIPPERRWFR